MTHQAVIHYIGGSIGSADVIVREEALIAPFSMANVYIGQKWEADRKLLHGVFDYDRNGFLTNHGEAIRDGWQKVSADSVDYIEIRADGGYIYLPPSDVNHPFRSAMIDQLERAFV